MPFYTNHTRFSSIVTIKIVAVVDVKNAVKIGIPSALEIEKIGSTPGYHDFLVGPHQVLELVEGTQAELVNVRCAP